MFSVFVFLLLSVSLGSIRNNDPVAAGDELLTHVNIINDGTEDAEELRVMFFIPELGMFWSSTRTDVDKGEKKGKFFMLEIPEDMEPGYYYTRVVLSNDKMRKVYKTSIEVI